MKLFWWGAAKHGPLDVYKAVKAGGIAGGSAKAMAAARAARSRAVNSKKKALV